MKVLNKYSKHPLTLCLLFVLAFSACKKDKMNMDYDNRAVTDVRKGSTVRIINLAGYNQVQVNGDTLTNYVVRAPNSGLGFPGTPYFLTDGKLGSTWTVPQDLFAKGPFNLFSESVTYNGKGAGTQFVVKAEQTPVDYYMLSTILKDQPEYMKIPRAIAAPADPAKFKIRILNLAATVNASDNVEDVRGPLSLAWADGTLVSPATNNIQPGQYSDYIELPYCTAQFKVLTAQGYQVAGSNSAEVIDPSNSTLVSSANLTYAPVKTYFPVGIYTIVIGAKEVKIPYPGSSNGESVTAYQNVFQVINDIADPKNLTYSRLQAVNVMPGMDGVKIMVNGQSLGTAMAYAAHTDYQSFIMGDYKIEAMNASGTKLAETALKLEANKNFSIWVYPDANGNPAVKAVANDLSATYYDDLLTGTEIDYLKQAFPFQIRFLNFCADVPYLTMTGDDGQAFGGLYPVNANAVNNLMPGVPPAEAPYLSLHPESTAYQFMAFRSTPTIIPGTWAKDIPVLTGQDLIARPELYARTGLPNHEAGIYTIALIGSTKATAPAAQKAKMIILKHNK